MPRPSQIGHAAIIVGLPVDSTKGAGIHAVVGCVDLMLRHRRYCVAPQGSEENEKHVFLVLPRRARARLYVQSAEEFIVVPFVLAVFVANAARLEIGDVEMTGEGACLLARAVPSPARLRLLCTRRARKGCPLLLLLF